MTLWAISTTNSNFPHFSPRETGGRKAREISFCCKNCSKGSFSYFDFPLNTDIELQLHTGLIQLKLFILNVFYYIHTFLSIFYHFLQKRFCRFDFSLFYVWSPWDVPNFEEISSKTSNPLINFLRTVFSFFSLFNAHFLSAHPFIGIYSSDQCFFSERFPSQSNKSENVSSSKMGLFDREASLTRS